MGLKAYVFGVQSRMFLDYTVERILCAAIPEENH
jgi:hypothetical protein